MKKIKSILGSSLVLLGSLALFAGCNSKGDDVLSYINDLFTNKDSSYKKVHADERKNLANDLKTLASQTNTPNYFNNFFSIYNSKPDSTYQPPNTINPFVSTIDKDHPDAKLYDIYNSGFNPYNALASVLNYLADPSSSDVPTNINVQPYFEIASDGSNISDINKGGEIKINSKKTYLVSFQISIYGMYQYSMLAFKIDPSKHIITASLPGSSNNSSVKVTDNILFGEKDMFNYDQYSYWIDKANENVTDPKQFPSKSPFKEFDPKYLSFQTSLTKFHFPYFITTSKDFQLTSDKNNLHGGYYISKGYVWMLAIIAHPPKKFPEINIINRLVVLTYSNFKYDSSKHDYKSMDVDWSYYEPWQQIFGG